MVTVTWTAPPNNGRAITGFDLQYCNQTAAECVDAGTWTDVAVTGTSVVAQITGLLPGDNYRVRVRAKNTNVVGAWSPTRSARTDSEAPTLTAADASIVASWTAPRDNGAESRTRRSFHIEATKIQFIHLIWQPRYPLTIR